MSRPAPPGRASARRDRLQAYSRLLTVLADQMEALEQGDAARAQELSDRRRQLEEELEASPEPDPAAGPVHQELTELLARTAGEVESLLRAQQELREHWTRLRDGALASGRTVRTRPLSGRYPEPISTGGPRLDLRL